MVHVWITPMNMGHLLLWKVLRPAWPMQAMPNALTYVARFTDGLVVREGGLEPPRPYEHWHLKPARLPFRHSRE